MMTSSSLFLMKHLCCVCINERGKEEKQLRYAELWQQSVLVANMLSDKTKLNNQEQPLPHIILCYPFGLDFIVSYVGCLLANTIAVPVYPPNPGSIKQSLLKLNKVVDNCKPILAPTNSTFNRYRRFNSIIQKWPKTLQWLCTDTYIEQNTKHINELFLNKLPGLSNDKSQIAFIQYTSGSTGDPKGVCISYTNFQLNR
ncbi:unnamed protein product [Didymodactylos carnosus]|uniref:AMP-dependent synthetase/ligase domain-containing protein n=1 Tax=Didymodactylos carnosus TaxID=1234261 RepID=A0A816D669_9BILA|nr:unnamed protein product [Didymodactylos carnosus]CAF4537246.1 unnamed protein product [Didymodactylos carnosus]